MTGAAGGSHDVVVAGLGAMGSAAAFHLARRGARVLGFDARTPPHDRGSSHGESRIIREAYYEHPAYVPLVRRAFELWRELEGLSDRPLLRRTGILNLGPRDGELIRGVLRSVEEHSLPHQRLDAAEVARRFPRLRPAPGTAAVYEERAGVLDAEGGVQAQLDMARANGAALRFGEAVREWREDGEGVEVVTDAGRRRAGALVLTVGPWLPGFLPELPVEVERQTTHWFRPREPEGFSTGRFPVFLWETETGSFYYGMPDLGKGVKAARHHGGETGPLDSLDDEVREAEVAEVRRFLASRVPAANGEHLRSAVCRYTNTPSAHFLVDRLPGQGRVWVASPCSGHGFKFAPVIGEVLADLVTEGTTRHEVSLFARESAGKGPGPDGGRRDHIRSGTSMPRSERVRTS